jgi:hypothetical protein
MNDIELFADTILLLCMTAVALVLMQVDPLLPVFWTAATMFMTWRH